MDLTWATGAYARRRGVPVLLSIHTRLENPAAPTATRSAFLDADAGRAPAAPLQPPRWSVMDSYMDDYIKERYRGRLPRPRADPGRASTPAWVRAGTRDAAARSPASADDAPIILSVGHVIPVRDRLGLVEALPRGAGPAPRGPPGRRRPGLLRPVPAACRGAGRRPRGAQPRRRAQVRRSRTCWPRPTVESHEQGLGLGTATLESMAAGTPVVGLGPRRQLPRRADDRRRRHLHVRPVGDVAGLADAPQPGARRPRRAAAIGASARAIVDQHFALDRVLERHLEVLDDLVGDAAPRATR